MASRGRKSAPASPAVDVANDDPDTQSDDDADERLPDGPVAPELCKVVGLQPTYSLGKRGLEFSIEAHYATAEGGSRRKRQGIESVSACGCRLSGRLSRVRSVRLRG